MAVGLLLSGLVRIWMRSGTKYLSSAMALIDKIWEKIQTNHFEFSKHAVDQSIIRRISVRELKEAVENGEVIEDYLADKYGPSCLIFGLSQQGRPLHVQCSYPSRPLVKIITLYEPDPTRWINYRRRR